MSKVDERNFMLFTHIMSLKLVYIQIWFCRVVLINTTVCCIRYEFVVLEASGLHRVCV